MGTRLYPVTREPRSLERLCGVPAGTHDRLDALRARYKVDEPWGDFHEGERRYEAYYDAKLRDEAVGDLDNFLLFGWGKFRFPPEVTPSCSGSLTDLDACRRLLQLNGIALTQELLELTQGLCWS